jgi:hypothetical protein
MKVRIVQKPEYTMLFHVQVKKQWFPFWQTTHVGCKQSCERAAQNLMKHGTTESVIFEGETK